MKYTKATDYALHIVANIMEFEDKETLSLQTLSATLDVSPTYLSKILTQLAKAGIIESSSGKNGGYRLSKKKEDISFLDVIKAIEGAGYQFSFPIEHDGPCKIQEVMRNAEDLMFSYLESRKLYEVNL